MQGNFPLGNFYENINGLQSPQQNSVAVDFRIFNADRFFEMMKSIDMMSDSDLIICIKNYIDTIVDKTLSDDKSMGSILSHPRFVDAYYRAMQAIPMNHERRLFANKLTYEYAIIDNPNPDILRKFRDISEYVNKPTIIKLTRIGLNAMTANDLAVCRYSSRHERINVQRLNFCMCKNYSPDIFTEQMVIHVYEELFDRISELFIGSMLEVYPARQLDEFGQDFKEVYGNISLAILTILNNMPSISIRQVVKLYTDAYILWYQKTLDIPRFTLRALSQDYGRIVNVVESMLSEGYDVP